MVYIHRDDLPPAPVPSTCARAQHNRYGVAEFLQSCRYTVPVVSSCISVRRTGPGELMYLQWMVEYHQLISLSGSSGPQNFACYCDRVLGHRYFLWLKNFAGPFLPLDPYSLVYQRIHNLSFGKDNV